MPGLMKAFAGFSGCFVGSSGFAFVTEGVFKVKCAQSSSGQSNVFKKSTTS